MMVASFLLGCSDGSIHYKHVAQCHRVRAQDVIITTIALQVPIYYVVESNYEDDSYIYFKGKTHVPECLFKAPEDAQVQSS